MTSRLRAMADRAEKVQGQREAWQRMEASVRERQILDLQDMSPDDIIEAARAIHSGDDDGWLPRVEASLADAEARWEAGERPRCADARRRPATASGDPAPPASGGLPGGSVPDGDPFPLDDVNRAFTVNRRG